MESKVGEMMQYEVCLKITTIMTELGMDAPYMGESDITSWSKVMKFLDLIEEKIDLLKGDK